MKHSNEIPEPDITMQEDRDDTGNILKHESAERIFSLLLFLLANYDCTRKEIFEHLASHYRIDQAAPLEQCSSRRADRMFERDINFLEDLGFEIKKARGKARLIHYSLVKGSGPRATFLFTNTEADSLALLHNIFADPTRYARPDLQQPLPQSLPRNPFSEEILALIEKLASTLPLEQREHFDRSVRKPFVYFNLSTVADYLPHRPIVDTIVHAISHRQQIQFKYTSTRNMDNGIIHEHIDPYYITYMEGHFYLIAFSHKSNHFLEYRIDRIKAESLREMPNMIDMERRRYPFEFRFWLDGNIAASLEHIKQELENLEAELFFPEWQDHLFDITYLAHGHQVMSQQGTQSNQNFIQQCQLDGDRLEGPLCHLMKFADAADNSHSGDYATHDEKHIRDKLVQHLNPALYTHGHARRFRFIGHRLAELRGIETNIMHNQIVAFLQERYGKDTCIDLLYHPTGVDYLLDKNISFNWSSQDLRTLAQRIGQKFAQLQSDQLAQFIKAKPSGISVDDAAMQSGAPLHDIFMHMRNIAERKQYKLEWREQRDAFARQDLESYLTEQSNDANLQEQVGMWLRETSVVPGDEEALKRGEFLMAYRNFLKDHREEQLKTIKQDAWDRVARLYQIPPEHDAIYNLIDPYRRGYCMARDLPVCSLDAMLEDALVDLTQLEKQASQVVRKGKKGQVETPSDTEIEGEEASVQAFDDAYLVDYLERNLNMWDSVATVPAQSVDFSASLRRYVDSKRQHTQCCYCGSTLQAGEWMAIQVPPNIGVQSFSNRLEAGTSREPKRNVCDVCRIQFILEKLAWRSHRDKQGGEQVTFYLHCFPYSFFTQPLLLAWWQSITKLGHGDHTALFLDTRSYFTHWEKTYVAFQQEARFTYRGLEGVSIPAFPEALSNTPILPLIIGKSSGKSYGHKFLLALEKAVLLSLWFDCRIILSRLPTPLLNLENERINDEPVALLVENVPQVMSWLLSTNTETSSNMLTRSEVTILCQRLQGLHQIAEKLTTNGEEFYSLIYDLITAASTDPLELYHETDRYIERFVAQKKSKHPDSQAINISHAIAPLIETLLT